MYALHRRIESEWYFVTEDHRLGGGGETSSKYGKKTGTPKRQESSQRLSEAERVPAGRCREP